MDKELELIVEEVLMRDTTPLPAESASFLRQVRHFFLLWSIKLLVAVQLAYLRICYPTPKTRPTFTRIYSCRPSLEVRVFTPKSRVSGDNSLLPLYLSIHGGAFATCDAGIDDSFCTKWCERTGMVVASLNYRKAPIHRFLVAVLDIAAVARAVIDDESLHIDKSRLPELQGRIRAAVSFFPIVDWSAPPPMKFAKRLCTEKATESIATAGPALDWGYVPAGQDRKAKLLSPCFADKEELPKWICMIGAQHDMLSREARDMIFSLAGKRVPDSGWDQGFEHGAYKWVFVKGVRHGFTDEFRKRSQNSEARRKICNDTYASIHSWLREKVLV